MKNNSRCLENLKKKFKIISLIFYILLGRISSNPNFLNIFNEYLIIFIKIYFSILLYFYIIIYSRSNARFSLNKILYFSIFILYTRNKIIYNMRNYTK